MTYTHYLLKRAIEDIVMYPLILIGKLIALFNPLKKEYDVFFFFPFYHTGGAEKVHAQISKACGNSNCIIFFTRKSHNDTFYSLFNESNCTIKDISRYTDNKFLYPINIIYRGIITRYINKQQNVPVVFNGQCNFGYKIAPWIQKSIPQIELIHSFNTFSLIRIPFIPFYNTTVMISQQRIKDHYIQYDKLKIPASYKQRICYIANAIDFKPINNQTKTFVPIRVLFSGRGSAEKRIHLFAAIAKGVNSKDPSINFEILGNVDTFLDPTDLPFIKFHGELKDPTIIRSIYQQATILLLTSSTEGFPLVIIEAMAHECCIVATPVGDIPYHIQPHINGYLFSTIEDEERIIAEGVAYILSLKLNQSLLQQITLNNKEYANKHFSIEQFNQSYQQLFNSVKQ